MRTKFIPSKCMNRGKILSNDMTLCRACIRSTSTGVSLFQRNKMKVSIPKMQNGLPIKFSLLIALY